MRHLHFVLILKRPLAMFFELKMFVASYFLIYSFHPSLNLHKSDGWFDFVVNCEHLFLSNSYTSHELEMDIETKEKYSEILYRLLELYPLFEKKHLITMTFQMKLVEELNECYSTYMELKENGEHVPLPKKKSYLQKIF